MKCQCKPGCEAEVKTKGCTYARGHAPASHTDYAARAKKISKSRRRFFANGGKSWWLGKHHSPRTKVKMRVYHSSRPKSHRKNLREAIRVSESHHQAVLRNAKLATDKNTGRHRPIDIRVKIGQGIRAARKRYNWAPWNKGKRGLQVSWNKGLTKATDLRIAKYAKKLVGHPLQFTRWKCWYPNNDQKEICMRSSYEVAFANWLDFRDIQWQYEPKAFHVGIGAWGGVTYTPDFYLPDQRAYVELKGWFSKSNKRKMARFYKLYPDVKLYMFFGQHLKQAKILPFRKAA